MLYLRHTFILGDYVAGLKRKKDRRSKEVRDTETRLKRKMHWLDCKECGLDGAEVDGTVKAFTCWRCVAKTVAPPELPTTVVKKYAEYKDSFKRGWWKKILFSGEHDGETLYFSRGKKISKAEYNRLMREQV